jgi:uncharacterized protein (TIGR03435 family)
VAWPCVGQLVRRAHTGSLQKLAVHSQTREIPVLAFVLAKPSGILGKPGPQLRQHQLTLCRFTFAPPTWRPAADPPQGSFLHMVPSIILYSRLCASRQTIAEELGNGLFYTCRTKPLAGPFVLTPMTSFSRAICSLALAGAAAVPSPGQVGGSQLAFEVASVRRNKSDAPPYSNFPLNSGDFYTANGGLFSAANFPLVTYIFFAYKLQGNQGQSLVAQLPAWVMTDRFDIQARTDGNPTKDQMRLMMRSLLADRFKLAVHTETREVPVLAFVFAKPGGALSKPGPQLQPHPSDAPCSTSVAPPSAAAPIPDAFRQMVSGGFPALCNGILGMPPGVPGRSRLGGRNVTIGFMADLLSQRVNLGRPMIDATGLTGTFDFLLEFTPESQAPAPPGLNVAPDPDGPTFEQALRDQLGLKMESRRSPMEIIVLDRVEHPSDN